MSFSIDKINGSTDFGTAATGATLKFEGTVPVSLESTTTTALRVECRVLLGRGSCWVKTNCRITNSGSTWTVTFPVLDPPRGVTLRVVAHLLSGATLSATAVRGFSFASP